MPATLRDIATRFHVAWAAATREHGRVMSEHGYDATDEQFAEYFRLKAIAEGIENEAGPVGSAVRHAISPRPEFVPDITPEQWQSEHGAD